MNFTGRMESYTVGGQVLVSPSTYKKLSHILEVKNEIHVEMKEMTEKVTLYGVIGIGGEYDIHLPSIEDILVLLKQPIAVRIYRMDEKRVTDSSFAGNISHASLTSAILVLSVVFLESILLNASIRENIALGRPESTEEEIRAAAEAAEIHNSIVRMPDGYKTRVGERRAVLSGFSNLLERSPEMRQALEITILSRLNRDENVQKAATL